MRTPFFFLLISALISLCCPLILAVDFNYPAIFNFGDSNSDTGGLIAGLGERLDPPNGQTFFKKPSGRFCDGRLIIDFLCGKIDRILPREDYFKQGLYMFDIGQNDLAGAFYSKSEDQVIASIPIILLEFEVGIKKLYDQGARRFWIHNTGPLGCLPQNIAVFGKDPSKLDELGCVSSHNRASKLFNLQLHALSSKFQGQFTDANVTFIDIFSIKYELISNFSRYGFEHSITACCGYGGPPLNYDSRVACGQTKSLNGSSVTAKGCDDTTEYINWDGIHYTEAANLQVSSLIVSGRYADPPFSDRMPFLLKLKF
ncbi:GDSL-like Lipase/Acylhydrolase superfamily protein isoform X3 [Tasmannia lanceolata]|uniref:GDSL-like Lipase/Acylhydrolase superfamily protein isoform X3 n=1 Tax=Tasmannia lanceolata TaxID=3420 RepID=UPI004063C113